MELAVGGGGDGMTGLREPFNKSVTRSKVNISITTYICIYKTGYFKNDSLYKSIKVQHLFIKHV